MDNVWEKIKRGLREGAELSMEKIEEYTKIGKLKIEEMAAKRKIERNYMDMGQKVFDLMQESREGEISRDATVRKAVENIVTLKKDLAVIAQKIEQVQEEAKKTKEKAESEGDELGV